MYEYRQALMRMRQGDSEREIARSKLMGRSKAARFRELADAQGWLDPTRPVPTDAEIAAVLGRPRLPVSAQSSIAAYRALLEQWLAQGVSGVVIHATLAREHGFTGHYSSVRRLIAQIGRDRAPEATVRLTFAPGEAAQVDFGAGPQLVDPATAVPSSGSAPYRRGSSSTMPNARSRRRVPTTRKCSAPMPNVPRVTAFASTPARPTTHRRRASSRPG